MVFGAVPFGAAPLFKNNVVCDLIFWSVMAIVAAVDGSALGNPGAMGWSWYVDDSCWGAGGALHGTNNQGELLAVLELLKVTVGCVEQELHIVCDSQYVINSLTKWLPGWKRKGWRKADGKLVLNVGLLQEIDILLQGRVFSFEWVRGHSGHVLNEAVDVRARAAALSFSRGEVVVSGPGFTLKT